MYEPTQKQRDQIEAMFTYHPPLPGQRERFALITESFKDVSTILLNVCPDSRELSVALTLLQQARMMANAAIACNEKPKEEKEDEE